MAHFKCADCRTRLHTTAGTPDPVGHLCPECGCLLEPVGKPSEVVGFRSIEPRDDALDGDALGTRKRLSERLGDLIAHRDATLAQARLDAQYWVDDGGSFRAEAVALPHPEIDP
jgi:hypothetical protein